MTLRYGGPMFRKDKPNKKDAKAKAPRVKPGSLGWALFGDDQTGGGADPVDFISQDHVKRPDSDETKKGGFVVEVIKPF